VRVAVSAAASQRRGGPARPPTRRTVPHPRRGRRLRSQNRPRARPQTDQLSRRTATARTRHQTVQVGTSTALSASGARLRRGCGATQAWPRGWPACADRQFRAQSRADPTEPIAGYGVAWRSTPAVILCANPPGPFAPRAAADLDGDGSQGIGAQRSRSDPHLGWRSRWNDRASPIPLSRAVSGTVCQRFR